MKLLLQTAFHIVCVTCHQSLTPGAYHAWKESTHSNLDAIRSISDPQ
jgi:hydroxylamine dehydrogenase